MHSKPDRAKIRILLHQTRSFPEVHVSYIETHKESDIAQISYTEIQTDHPRISYINHHLVVVGRVLVGTFLSHPQFFCFPSVKVFLNLLPSSSLTTNGSSTRCGFIINKNYLFQQKQPIIRKNN